MARGPQRSIEQENEEYVLHALDASKDGAGIREISLQVHRFLKMNGKRRKLSDDQLQAVLASLVSQGKVSRRRGEPVTWVITFEGKRRLPRE